MAQSLFFETPTTVKATIPVNITWNPRTFNSVNLGNFSLNLWLLRQDATTDATIVQHAAQLLAHNQSVFDNSVLWTPTLDDVDVDVPDAGASQLAWEETSDNPGLDPSDTDFQGFSQGFGVKSPPSSTTTAASSSSISSISSISSSTAVASSSASPTNTASPSSSPSPSKSNLPTILGLSIGLGLLLLVGIGAAFWGVRKYRRVLKSKVMVPPKDSVLPPSYSKMTARELEAGQETKPVELSS